MATAETNHVEVDEQGVARIVGTTTKVIEVIADYKNWGWTADLIHRQYPYLSLAQIHAAFVYYYDHQKEIEEELSRRDDLLEKMRLKSPETPGRQKLREHGHRP